MQLEIKINAYGIAIPAVYIAQFTCCQSIHLNTSPLYLKLINTALIIKGGDRATQIIHGPYLLSYT